MARLDGSKYLLKHRLTSRVSNRASGLSRRLFEELIYGDQRVAFNDQSLLLGARFTLSALRRFLLRHFELVSHWFVSAVKCVPQSGIEPERREWARDCKSRLSASSSTGGYKKELNAGAAMPLKTSPVPAWFFRPSSAALLPLPWHFSSISLERNILVRNRRVLPSKKDAPPIFFFALHFVREATQNLVNTSHRSAQARKIVALVRQFLANFWRGEFSISLSQHCPHSISNSQIGNIAGRTGHVRQWCKVLKNFIEVGDFMANLGQICFEVSTKVELFLALLPDSRPLAHEVRLFHNYGG